MANFLTESDIDPGFGFGAGDRVTSPKLMMTLSQKSDFPIPNRGQTQGVAMPLQAGRTCGAQKETATLIGQVRIEIDNCAGRREKNSKWVIFFLKHGAGSEPIILADEPVAVIVSEAHGAF